MLRIGIIVVLLAHGLWHALGPAVSWGSVQADWAMAVPWNLSRGVSLQSLAGRLTMALWVGALVVLLAGTYALATRQDWYRVVLPLGAALSILAVWPWTSTVPENQWFHILGIDVLILIALLFRWQFRFPWN